MSVNIGFSVRGGQTKGREIRKVRPAFMLMGINYGEGREQGFGSGLGRCDKDTWERLYNGENNSVQRLQRRRRPGNVSA